LIVDHQGVKMVVCPKCHKEFERKGRNFNNHVKFCGRRFKCPHCPESCCNPSNLNRHIQNCHPETKLNRSSPFQQKRVAEDVFFNDAPLEPSPKKLIEDFSIADLVVPPPPKRNYTESNGVKRKFDQNHESQLQQQPQVKQKWRDYQGMSPEAYKTAVDQMGGKLPLFEFEITDIPTKNKNAFKRLTKNIYHAELHQRRVPEEQDDIGVALAMALETAAKTQLKRLMEKEHLSEDSKVYFSMTPNGFPRAYQTKKTTVKDILEGSMKTDWMFRKMAGKLNSNESYGGNQTFQMDLIVLTPKFTGRGHGKRLNPGRAGFKHTRQTKRSIITIKNSDDLCCARSIVTMQAHSAWKVLEKQIREELSKDTPDDDLLEDLYLKEKEALQKYENMRKGRGEQTREAKQLHWCAGVPEGPCGIPELKTFQDYLYTLTPPYQLKVVEDLLKKPIYMGEEKVEDDYILILVRSPNHYDGCTSLSGFFNKSYWCHDCDRAFDHNDVKKHRCQGRVCQACHVKNCPDKHPSRPTLECPDCGGVFYGPSCFQAHQLKKGKANMSICDQWHRCPDCCMEYRVLPKKPHKCGWIDGMRSRKGVK